VSRDLHGVSLDPYWLAGEGLPDLADSYLEGYRLAEIGRQAELIMPSFRDEDFTAPIPLADSAGECVGKPLATSSGYAVGKVP
jgi:hypothetical protein